MANYAKSWFHTAVLYYQSQQLNIDCAGFSAWGDAVAYLWEYRCHCNAQRVPSGLITPSHLYLQPSQSKPRFQGFTFSFNIWGKTFVESHSPPHSIPFPSRLISWLAHTWSTRHRESCYIQSSLTLGAQPVSAWPRNYVHSLTFAVISCQQLIRFLLLCVVLLYGQQFNLLGVKWEVLVTDAVLQCMYFHHLLQSCTKQRMSSFYMFM